MTSIHANKERAMAVVSVVTLLVASCTVHDARVRAATPPLETQVLQDEVTECGRALGRLEAMALLEASCDVNDECLAMPVVMHGQAGCCIALNRAWRWSDAGTSLISTAAAACSRRHVPCRPCDSACENSRCVVKSQGSR